MNTMLRTASAVLLALFMSAPSPIRALGECGYACCIASSGLAGMGLSKNFGLSLQYENSNMNKLMRGTEEISADEAIAAHWKLGGRYMVPLEHRMQKITLTGVYTVNEKIQLLAVVPWVINDMSMRMKMTMTNGMGMKMPMVTDTVMDQVSGLGDILLMANWTVTQDTPIRPSKRLSVGAGVKTATGKNDTDSAAGSRIHAPMQPGTGSVDPIVTANLMRAWYPLVLQANVFYEMTTEGNEGYEFGDQFAWDANASWQVWDFVSVNAGLSGTVTGKDLDHKGKFSRAAMSLLDNPAYSGLHSTLAGIGAQIKIPKTPGSVSARWQIPIYQHASGYMNVLKERLILIGTVAF